MPPETPPRGTAGPDPTHPSRNDPRRWERTRSIFERALQLEGAQRDAFLAERCGGDAELEGEIRALLEADGTGEWILDGDAREALRPEEAPSTIDRVDSRSDPDSDRVIGPYRLLEKVGEGGMGEVWLAEQHEPVRREVALKIIKRGMDSARVVERFAAERQALALMDHPAICKVLDAGTTPGGRPYFVMEYVRGVRITEHCDRERLTTRQRLSLFLEVCEGVQHAHQKGIIHRDLKPSNVLVALRDGRGVPKIIDFGVAKATMQRLTDRTLHTELGVLIGTPEYMSPEQADLTGQDIDTRTDVYSLGVLLYELLAGVLPFEPEELRRAGFDEIRRRIREVDPPTPSTRMGTLDAGRTAAAAKARRTEPAALRRELRGDLDWIVMRALAKERARRYGSPSELAADIRRHLADEPVLAGPPGAAYRLGKFVRRHSFGVGIGAGVAVLLVGSIVTLAVQAGRLARSRDRANRTASELEQVAKFQAAQLSGIDPERMGVDLERRLMDMLRSAFERTMDDPARIESRLADLRREMAPVNFTNVALGTLEETIFDRALTTIDAEFEDQPLVRARLLQSLADTLVDVSLRDEAEAPQTEALRIRRALLGDLHPDTLTSIAGMARVRARHDSSLDDAVRLYREAVEGRTRVLGPEHRDTLEATVLHARVVLDSRSDVEGPALAREVLERCIRVLGEDDPLSLKARLDLWSSLSRKLEFEEAAAELRLTHRLSLSALGADHPITQEANAVLGGLLWSMGRLDGAEPLLREALEVQRKKYGEDHWKTIGTAQNLAVVLDDQGRLDEAVALSERVLETSERRLGPHNRTSLAAGNNLAFLRYKQGRLAEAEAGLRYVLEHYGPSGDDPYFVRGNLAMVHVARGRAAEAEPLARDALAHAIEIKGPESWDVAHVRGQLGLALTALGRFDEAERELLEAHGGLFTTLGDHHERTRRVEEYLADLYTARDAAEPGAGHAASAERWRKRLIPARGVER